MAKSRAAPGLLAVVQAIVARENKLALSRNLVRALFLISIASPLGFAGILLFRKAVERMVEQELDWDPIVTFLRIQCIPLALLALGLGAPAMIQDKRERALALYAARPVTPLRYALARVLAVAIPVAALLIFPGWGIIGLRMGILEEATVGATLLLGLKIFVCALPIAWAYGGITVSAGAVAPKMRWALLFTAVYFLTPDWIAQALELDVESSIGPSGCATRILEGFFENESWLQGIAAAAALMLYGTIGLGITAWFFKRKATP